MLAGLNHVTVSTGPRTPTCSPALGVMQGRILRSSTEFQSCLAYARQDKRHSMCRTSANKLLILSQPTPPVPGQALRRPIPLGPAAAHHQLVGQCPGLMPTEVLRPPSSLQPSLQLLRLLPLWRGKALQLPGQLPPAPPLVTLLSPHRPVLLCFGVRLLRQHPANLPQVRLMLAFQPGVVDY